MSDTKAVERIEAFKKEFLAEGSECTWKDYPLATDVLDWLRLQEQNFHQELQKARKSERELVIAEINKKYWLNPKRSKSDVAKDNAWNDLGNTLRNGV